MNPPKRSRILLIALVLVLLAGLVTATIYYGDLPNRISQHETIVLGQNQLVPGSQAAFRVVVRDSKDASPLSNAAIKALLKPADGENAMEVFSGETDEKGTADIRFAVPEDVDPDQTLIIRTTSALGSDEIEREITLKRDYRLLVTTDKPIYQPGQTIHIRALALSTFDLSPASGQKLEFEIADGKGNKVLRKKLTTSEYGVAFTDFQLAGEVNAGPYKITATLDTTSSEKTVTVEHYVLPKFKVSLSTDRTFYQPGTSASGELNVNYLFGKPVAGGKVLIEGYTFDVERVPVFNIEGTTDQDGYFQFDFELPQYIAGTDLEGGLGQFYLQATVTDLTEHNEVANLSLPVSETPIIIEAIPEGGEFRAGVENLLYVLTSYPDGSPVQTDLTLDFYSSGQTLQVQTGEFGVAEIRYTPQDSYQEFQVSARDHTGAAGSRQFYFEGRWSEETVLLRPDSPIYRVGDTMNLTILTSQSTGTAYLDIIREGQTISTRAVDIENGQAKIAVDLTPDLFGTLELHAYKILRSGDIERDTRLVVVDNAAGLSLTLTPNQETYLPGQDASVNIGVTDPSGDGVQAALGIAIVDESVFALAEQDPGFAKLYFMLEQELLQPKYELHGFSVPDLVQGLPVNNIELVSAVEEAAQASLAAAAPQSSGFSLQANSHQDAINRAENIRTEYFSLLSKILYAFLLGIPLAGVLISGTAVRRENHLGRSILAVIAGLLALYLLLLVWPHPWASGPLDKLGEFFDWLGYGGEGFVISLFLAGFISFIILIVVAARKKDRRLGWLLFLSPIYIGLIILTLLAVDLGQSSPKELFLIIGMIAFILLPGAYFLRAAGFAWERRGGTATAALLAGFFILMGTVPAVALVSYRSPVANQALRGGDRMVMEEMAFDEALPMEAPAMDMGKAAGETNTVAGAGSSVTSAGSEPPRLRQYFPETMLWLPDAVTDSTGNLTVEFPVADSITTWRMTALASSQDGQLGSATAPLRVFQDFFVDLDLPVSLTVGDEISIPVGVYNYLAEEQTVRLEIEEADWFELLDESVKEISIASNDITVVYFRIKAKDFGTQPVKVTAWGSKMSDAIRKEVRVYPDGKQINFSSSDRIDAENPVLQTASIPSEAIAGTQKLSVKIYPGVISQIVEGLDSLLRMPYGCFEQTSSTTYPNILVLDYLKTTDQASPEVQFKAEEYINLGYQRLVTFEVGSSGGFSLFGEAPADPMLTAYGLQEFNDMSRVLDVDPAIMERAADWLINQQNADGSWQGVEGFHESGLTGQVEKLPVTAYVVWGLADAGFAADNAAQRGTAYLREVQSQASDPYTLALVANALVAEDKALEGNISSATQAVLDRLAEMAKLDKNSAYWVTTGETVMGSYGNSGALETTALSALAFLRSGTHPELANAALTYLIQSKDSFGTWETTQATVMALKAFLESVRVSADDINAAVTISLNDGQTKTFNLAPENFDVVQVITFEDIPLGAENNIAIRVAGKGKLMYQITGSYYLPWEKLSLYPELSMGEDLVAIQVNYDRMELAVNDTVTVSVSAVLNQPGNAESAIIDLGVPPGFTPETADLSALISRYQDYPEDYEFPTIERFELTGRQIILYVSNLSDQAPLEFSYRLRAEFPLRAQTPASTAYDYYNPSQTSESLPQTLVVTE